MEIALGERTAETVTIYFERSARPEIRAMLSRLSARASSSVRAFRAMLPPKARTLEEALADYRDTLRPGAASFGRTILADGRYVGDVWCYCIHEDEDPDAMLSFCVFEPSCRSQGAATRAVALFLEEAAARYSLRTVGAFTFSDNAASLRVLEKNGFSVQEEFSEDGRASKYLRRTL